MARHRYRLLKGRTLRSESLARLPFDCTLRRSIRLTLARYFWQITGVMTAILMAVYARYSIASSRNSETKAKSLASFALDRLATRAAQHLQDSARFPEPYISMGQLRDDVLRDEFSSRARQKLWTKVQAKVEGNSNVRSMVRESRTGEVSRVWEWIGAVEAIEPSPSGYQTSSPAVVESTPVGRLEGAPSRDSKMKRESRHWDEGRPIY